MTERLTVLPDDDGQDGRQHDVPGDAGWPLLDLLERTAMLTIARMGDNRLLVPLAAVGLRTEILTRRLFERATSELWHLYQLPTRNEVMALSEQLSALRFRVTQLEQLSASKVRR